jgi:flagellar hook-basal body complex protein FliE
MEISGLVRPAVENLGGLHSKKTSTAETKPTGGISFSQALDTLSQSQAESDALIQKLAAGEDVDLHKVMIATEQADINFRVALAIRDRLVDAYREVMRMSV